MRNRGRLINNMYLRRGDNGMFQVLAPTLRVGRHPSYFRVWEEFRNERNAERFMKATTDFLTYAGKKRLAKVA